jgi:hypothetical protein
MKLTMERFIGIFLILLFIGGCVLDSFWPANINPMGKQYIGDHNEISILPLGKNASNLANARILKDQVEKKHVETQQELLMKMNVDNAVYTMIMAAINFSIKQAEQSFNTVMGTFSQPGWLGAIALAWITKLWKNETMFSQSEVDALTKKDNVPPTA